MKIRIKLFSALLAAIVAVAASFHYLPLLTKPGSPSTDDQAFPPAEPLDRAELPSADAQASRLIPPPTSISADGFKSWESGYRWDPSNPGIASSADDADWLHENGFPDPTVEAHLRSIPMNELKALADRGNQSAVAIYAYRASTEGASKPEVLGLLSKSMDSGSVYAIKTAGDIFLSVDGFRDPVMASAYYQLQARAGDQAGFAQSYLVREQLTGEQGLRAAVLEELLWRNTNLSSAFPVSRRARPGFKEFVEKAVNPERN